MKESIGVNGVAGGTINGGSLAALVLLWIPKTILAMLLMESPKSG